MQLSIVNIVKCLALTGGAFCLSTAKGQAAETFLSPNVDMLEYGVVCDYLPDGAAIPAPDTNAGQIRRGGDAILFDIETDIVPARVGVAFGIRVLLNDAFDTHPVTMVTRHPTFGSQYLDSESWQSTLTGGVTSSRYFVFEFEYELTPGLWTMDIYLDGDLLVRKGFDVVNPDQHPDLSDPCPGAAQIS